MLVATVTSEPDVVPLDRPLVSVEVVPDWLEWVTACASLVTALLALLAIWYAGRLAQRTREEAALAAQQAQIEAAEERRLQFELSVLAEMSRQHDITGLQHLGGYARSIIRPDSPEDDLPLLRTLEDVHPTELGAAKDRDIEAELDLSGPAGRGTRDLRRLRAVGREIEDAIDRRTGWSSPPETSPATG
jgi:hypothetical protein